ncbi:MAG: Fe-S protein assembly co-chaperone HscB [Polyangiales bacterium]
MATLDPFATLGLPRQFALDMKGLRDRHLDLSRALHPDRYASSPSAERRLSLSRAIEVNEAFRTLRDPIARAEALLQLEGLGAEIGETREPKASGDFLMQVLESREQLEEARASKSKEAVQAVLHDARAQFAAVEEELARMLDEALSATEVDRHDRLKRAIPLLGKLRYASRFMQDAIAAEDQLSGF